MPSNPTTGAAAPITDLEFTGPPVASALGNPPMNPAPASGPPPTNPAPIPAPSSGPVNGPPPAGGPGGALGGGPVGGPGSGGDPTPTPTPAPAPGAGGGGDDGSGGAQFDTKIADSLLSIIENATSADALEAQRIILRRIALQGDVVPSRVQPPGNITQIAGYLNLLESLGQTDMELQTLGGILGIAGSKPPQGLITAAPALTLTTFANDRPSGPAQRTVPVMVTVRSDLAAAVASTLASLRAQGCQVPFTEAPVTVPVAGLAGVARPDPLPYLGRTLTLVAATALGNPATDPLLLSRAAASTDPFTPAAQATGPGSGTVAPADAQALVCTSNSCNPVALSAARLVYLAPALAAAGFYQTDPPPQPSSVSDDGWARFSNTTGLVSGQTRLGDELALLYTANTINSSVYADVLGWTWNGSTFEQPIGAA